MSEDDEHKSGSKLDDFAGKPVKTEAAVPALTETFVPYTKEKHPHTEFQNNADDRYRPPPHDVTYKGPSTPFSRVNPLEEGIEEYSTSKIFGEKTHQFLMITDRIEGIYHVCFCVIPGKGPTTHPATYIADISTDKLKSIASEDGMEMSDDIINTQFYIYRDQRMYYAEMQLDELELAFKKPSFTAIPKVPNGILDIISRREEFKSYHDNLTQ